MFQVKQLERRSLKKKKRGFNGIRTRDLRDTGDLERWTTVKGFK